MRFPLESQRLRAATPREPTPVSVCLSTSGERRTNGKFRNHRWTIAFQYLLSPIGDQNRFDPATNPLRASSSLSSPRKMDAHSPRFFLTAATPSSGGDAASRGVVSSTKTALRAPGLEAADRKPPCWGWSMSEALKDDDIWILGLGRLGPAISPTRADIVLARFRKWPVPPSDWQRKLLWFSRGASRRRCEA